MAREIRIHPAIFACLAGIVAVSGGARAQEGPPPTLVETAEIASAPIRETVSFLGTVTPVLDSLVASEVEGRVARRLVENGDRVARGRVLVTLDDERLRKALAIARAQKNEITAELDLARRQEKRAKDLYRDEVLPQRDLDEAITRLEATESRLEAIDAHIESIEDDIARAEIRAPFAGAVTEIHTEVGEWLEVGAPVARVADLDTLEIRLEVPEKYFPYLSAGDPAPTTIQALPGVAVKGKILSVVPRADRDARTFPVLVRGRNPSGRVAAGMLARVELTLSTSENVLLVPKDAIVGLAMGQKVVFVVDGGTAKAVTVRTGRSSDARIEISGDLRAGQQVVVRGNERLQPGQPVRVGPSGSVSGEASSD